jgi:hypothetical protein
MRSSASRPNHEAVLANAHAARAAFEQPGRGEREGVDAPAATCFTRLRRCGGGRCPGRRMLTPTGN